MKTLKTLSSDALITNTKSLCAEERRITAEVLIHLAEIESRRLYAELGYPSLFAFAIKELRYSEGAASRRINAMRLMRQVPELEGSLRNGELNVTVVSMAKAATKGRSIDEKSETLKRLTGQSQREAERTLANLYPENVRTAARERMISGDAKQIMFIADEQLTEKLEKIKSLLSHKNPNPSYQELFHMMSDELLKRIDPEKQTRTITPAPAKHRAKHSRYIPRAMKREIWRRHGGRCSYSDPKSGRRCESRHLLQIDHIKPYARGGLTEPSNLRLICRGHNLYFAGKMGLLLNKPGGKSSAQPQENRAKPANKFAMNYVARASAARSDPGRPPFETLRNAADHIGRIRRTA